MRGGPPTGSDPSGRSRTRPPWVGRLSGVRASPASGDVEPRVHGLWRRWDLRVPGRSPASRTRRWRCEGRTRPDVSDVRWAKAASSRSVADRSASSTCERSASSRAPMAETSIDNRSRSARRELTDSSISCSAWSRRASISASVSARRLAISSVMSDSKPPPGGRHRATWPQPWCSPRPPSTQLSRSRPPWPARHRARRRLPARRRRTRRRCASTFTSVTIRSASVTGGGADLGGLVVGLPNGHLGRALGEHKGAPDALVGLRIARQGGLSPQGARVHLSRVDR